MRLFSKQDDTYRYQPNHVPEGYSPLSFLRFLHSENGVYNLLSVLDREVFTLNNLLKINDDSWYEMHKKLQDLEKKVRLLDICVNILFFLFGGIIAWLILSAI